ncbi:hypothetical protein COT75_00975 [Candidatus Beckwithbacteria bacterium CG10_big_fil_rev_8_21_14_0_10_34_10]|uniref:AB hydrolase-1 domain-containing protein n=1 Tax=Candidatus Beckwithbacteria bacterium CG10_big_fil_rev_8_21_14_0_10_34_10 TaxID=1974495 RepID=A0A2H0WC81_9BACT|nr:MAG: hypothetical protein COT75_00975 [Candidatus Beckwithbacteria bacterium CG10_big_fil_rev_8_21_14_0_10_34_10]
MVEYTSSFGQRLPSKNRASRQGALNCVDAALRQNLLKWTFHVLEKKMFDQRMFLEVGHVDTRKEPKASDLVFINLTGGWGRGPECDAEVEVLAHTMGDQGVEIVNVSLPGHGRSTNLPGGWENKEGQNPFDQSGEIISQFIRENYRDNEAFKKDKLQRKVILTAWSMGGVTVLKMAAKHPELIAGVVLMDTPVFPTNFRKLVSRFVNYGIRPKDIKPEEKVPDSFKKPGLKIFLNRIRDRNKPDGMPFGIVRATVERLSEQNLEEDGTLLGISENKIPVLVLHGQNDHVVPKKQILDLENCIRNMGGNVNRIEIPEAGHGLPAEKPKEVGLTISNWLKERKLSS